VRCDAGKNRPPEQYWPVVGGSVMVERRNLADPAFKRHHPSRGNLPAGHSRSASWTAKLAVHHFGHPRTIEIAEPLITLEAGNKKATSEGGSGFRWT
jgi:hypothetical protein